MRMAMGVDVSSALEQGPQVGLGRWLDRGEM